MSAVARTVVDDLREYQLEQENVDLRRTVKDLRHDLADMRATAEVWRRLYEQAMRPRRSTAARKRTTRRENHSPNG